MRWIGGLVLLAIVTSTEPTRAQSDAPAGTDSAPAAPAPADSAAAAPLPPAPAKPLAISGFVTAGYTYGVHHSGSALVGRFYDRLHDQFVLGAAKVVLEKPVATDRVDAGARVDLLLGQDAAVTKSLGLDLGANGDITQAYATLNLPAGEGRYVQFKAGKIATLMGLEVIEDVANPNLSVGNQFVYLENFTNTGLRVDVKPSARLDLQLAVINGWDVVTDNNTRKSFMGRVGITPGPATTVGLLGYVGNEKASVAPDTTPSGSRYGGEVLITQKFGAGTTVYLQGDYGEEKDLPAVGATGKWWGAGLWVAHDLSAALTVALRGDYVDDRNGVRTSGVFGFPPNARQKFGSGTVTLNVKRWENLLIRPEFRYDRSSLAAFGDAGDPKKDLFSFGLGASYLF